MDSMTKGTGLYFAERGCDEITPSFVATRTNLFPSHCMTEAGGMESNGSEQFYFSSPTPQTSNIGEKEMPAQV